MKLLTILLQHMIDHSTQSSPELRMWQFAARGYVSTAILAVTLMLSSQSRADEFLLVNREGQEEKFEAELMGSDKDWHALALPDGQFRLVPQAAIRKRTAKPGPTPLTAGQVADELKQEYGEQLFRYDVLDSYVVGLVLATPLPKTSEVRAKKVLDRATAFMKQVERAFTTFLNEAKIDSQKPKYPQVMLIFETDNEFEAYTKKITQSRGLQASMIAGFYSGLTNHLAIRLEECSNFDTPFHEAIHQQVYNRGLLQRLSPIPQWFDEGIATGFEAANGKILAHPTKVSARYGRQALRTNHMSWEDMHADDDVFRKTGVVTEAYGQAWGLHWLLITKYKTEYNKYLQKLNQKQPLEVDSAATRQSDFSTSFKKSLSELEQEFPQALQIAAKKQKLALDPVKPVGIATVESNLGKVTMTAVNSGGILRLEGQLTNLSPLRPMSFLVIAVSGQGTCATWFHDKLETNKSVPLATQTPVEEFPGPVDVPVGSTQIIVLSSPSDHPLAEEWRQKRGVSTLSRKKPGRAVNVTK